ncbi:(-)-germacrene D synthase [Morus notabilis]|uniref:(-)-germacrene D synthase n=1 Tax=Morus notabilis TaxID=981085 RepID=W9RZY1_9ROSA|nr:(-)-germacrene D synthase [Morus notabilis]
MSVASAVQSKGIPKNEIIRRSANYHPSIWRDYFLNYSSQSLEVGNNIKQEGEKLKEEVKRMLAAAATGPSENAELIDIIQRLGFSYHFESEISEILGLMKKNIVLDIGYFNNHDDLHTSALKFRLLRQQGYNIASDIFQKFINKEGKFNDDLTDDVKGMLSLYEAAHLRRLGEPILEEALAFTTTHLKPLTMSSSQLSPFLAAQVKHALTQPMWTGLPRLEVRRFISVYQEEPSHNDVLLRFAKLDFNILQKLHQQELGEMSRWWKNLDFVSKLPFARDRLVGLYFWILGVYFEPQYSLARRRVTKVIAMTSVLDDIYDIYGTPEELKLLTDAMERWNINCPDELPECIKYFYHTLLQVYKEIEEDMVKADREYCIQYAKEAMKMQVRSYSHEAKWFHEKYTPTLDEYMDVASMSSGFPLLTVISWLYMGDIVTEEALEWASKHPKTVRASSNIARLMDDLATHKVRV